MPGVSGRKGQGGVRPVQAVLRALDVLGVLQRAGAPLSVSEVARSGPLSAATAYRALISLEAGGLVEYDMRTQRYRAGSRLMGWSLHYLDQLAMRTQVRPCLQRLALAAGETALFGLRLGPDYIYVEQATGPQEGYADFTLGWRQRLHESAGGRAVLAYLAPELAQAYLAALPLAGRAGRYAELVAIRAAGYAWSGAVEGRAQLAAPVFAGRREVLGALVLAGPTEQAVADLVPLLTQEAAALSQRLGRSGAQHGT